MHSLCHDCDITHFDDDVTCIGCVFICSLHHKDDIIGKKKEELEEYASLPMRNFFDNSIFRGCKKGIYDTAQSEILYAVLLRLCKYTAEGMKLIFTDSAIDLLSHVSPLVTRRFLTGDFGVI